ncbi:DinB family protein [Allorhizobium taibaishanense]|uniref:Diguanylate cyclase n=1 Tax=Allorhizobium taibaishanense TaxID=887144 RepID=A0A1Q8ZZH6_9HYPH|nr:DinB family protein [Allorhizobium taibaishanense]MBB4007479.1 putative damage-inducible protein DinB [Allorhizobium taibaishanense]OLP47570.1 diguanylate cyclase [Allorhizobium taibaishanense]
MIDHWTMFAGYNAWVNQKLYEAASTLSEEELHRDTGAFFKSLFGTLSHLVVADQIWMQRLTGEGPSHQRLDDRPCPDLASLAEERRATDARIVAYCAALTPEQLADDIEYRRITTPDLVRQNLGQVLAHLFNHQTHHRGQAHMILTVLGKPSLALDLPYFQRLQKPA